MSGGSFSRKISDRFPADLPRMGTENDLLDWGSASRRVHPRSRGENRLAGDPADLARDLSPLTRENQHRPGHHTLHRGLIPAHTGKTRGRAEWPSPPRTIPAHTGKTLVSGPECSTGRAHPRSHGENDRRRASTFFSSGSSPLTRGKRATRCARRVRARLIPAHAGKTQMLRIGPLRRAAHPRSRGENL